MDQPRLFLASCSPRRAELLGQLDLDHVQISTDIDETRQPHEHPADYVQRLALAKATAGHQMAGNKAAVVTLGADTAVAIDARILGKPTSQAHAADMLRNLSGRSHRVFTGVAIVSADRQQSVVSHSTVTMRAIGDDEIAAYWRTGEPADKAGGYAIQGLGAVFVEQLEGSYSGVMGLPLFETAALLRQFGLTILA